MHKLFYHASSIGNLKELMPLSIQHGDDNKVCYFTPIRAYALFYLRDMDINHVTCGVSGDGIVTYFEEFPNQLKKIYQGRRGYLYVCENSTQITAGHAKGVWVAAQPVIFSSVEHVEDVYAEILKSENSGNVRVIRYESLSDEKKSEIVDKWKSIFIENKFYSDNKAKSRFFSENFPQAWEIAKAEAG